MRTFQIVTSAGRDFGPIVLGRPAGLAGRKCGPPRIHAEVRPRKRSVPRLLYEAVHRRRIGSGSVAKRDGSVPSRSRCAAQLDVLLAETVELIALLARRITGASTSYIWSESD